MTYDPNIGRWLEEDPIGFDGGDMNLYRMEGNGPADAVDPTGLSDLKFTPNDPELTAKFNALTKEEKAYTLGYASGLWNFPFQAANRSFDIDVKSMSESDAFKKGYEDARAGRPSSFPKKTDAALDAYNKYREDLIKNPYRITSLQHAVNRGSIDKTWTQQELLDFYIVHITPESSGLTKEQLAKGFEELRLLLVAINRINLGVTQDRCVKFANGVSMRVGPLTVLKTRQADWNTPWGLFPTMGPLGGFIDHRAMIITLPKSSLGNSNQFLQFGYDDALIGGIGNKEHIFGLGDIPGSYRPLGSYDNRWFFGWFSDSDPTLEQPAK